MQDRASLVRQLEQCKKNGDLDEEKLVTKFIELHNVQINNLQQKILESDQETRENTRWNMIHTIADVKMALKTLFHIVAQDRKQQCYKYNEVKEKNQNLEMLLEECKKRNKESKTTSSQNTSNASSNDAETLTKQVLNESNFSNENKGSFKK